MTQQGIRDGLWSKKKKNIRGELKLQLDCELFSTATYKESLCRKPTQAGETQGGEEKVSL